MTVSIIFALFLFFGIFSFAGAALLFIQYRSERKSYILLWAIGSILMGVGVIGVPLKDYLPELISYKIANSFTLAAALLFNYSLYSLTGKKVRILRAVFSSLIFACVIVASFVLVSIYWSPGYQPVVVSSFSAA